MRTLLSAPIFWVWSLALVVLGGAVETVAGERISDVFRNYTETGDPVLVRAVPEHGHLAMWVPGTDGFSGQRLADLSDMETPGQIMALQSDNGIFLGERKVNVLLTGNRDRAVSIIDMEPVAECTSFQPGTLIWLDYPTAGIQPTAQLVMDVEQTYPEALVYDPEDTSGEDRSYFEEQIIKLGKDEQQSVILRLRSEGVCTVNVRMTVVDGQDERKQWLFKDGEEVVVAGNDYNEDGTTVQHAYLGGEVCKDYETVPPNRNEIVELIMNGGCPSERPK